MASDVSKTSGLVSPPSALECGPETPSPSGSGSGGHLPLHSSSTPEVQHSQGRVDNLSAAHVSDLNATRHIRDGVVTDRRVVCAGHRSIRVPATCRGPNDDSREFDPDCIVNQAGVQRTLADGDGAWPAVGQAVEVGPIDGIVLDQRKSGRLDVYPT